MSVESAQALNHRTSACSAPRTSACRSVRISYPRCGARMMFEAMDDGLQSELAGTEPHALHHFAHEVGGNSQSHVGGLIVHGGESDAEERGHGGGLARV